MTKNIFEEAYAGIQEAKKAFDAATDEAGQEAARVLYREAKAPLDGLNNTEQRLWNAYETSKDCGNEYLDINAPVSDEAAKDLVEGMRELGLEAFTFSSTWSSAVETAWLFQKAGCSLAGLIEINSQHKSFMNDEYEKAHGYLFKLN